MNADNSEDCYCVLALGCTKSKFLEHIDNWENCIIHKQ